jgi:hypothetical protein
MNFERGQDPKKSLQVGLAHSRTVNTLTLMYRDIMAEFQGRPHPLKRETMTKFLALRPRRFVLSTGWGNFDNCFYDLDPSEFDIIFDAIYETFCQVKEFSKK